MGRQPCALALVLVLGGCGDDGSDGDGSGPATSGPVVTTGNTPTTDGPTTGDNGDTDDTGDTDPSDDTGPNASTGDTTGDPGGTTGADESTGEPVGPMGHFLAVGDGGRRVRSQDGVLWDGVVGSGLLDADDEMAPPDALRALAVGDGYIVAVGGGGNFWKGNAMVMRSTDGGVTWQEDLLKDKPDFSPHKLYAAAASGNVVIATGMRGKAIRSEDGGLEWTDISFMDQSSRLTGVASLGSTFVVAGWTDDAMFPNTSVLTASTDLGLTWSPVDHSFARLDAVVAGNDTFVAIGVSQCLRSADAITWVDCGPLTTDYKGVSFAGGEFLLSTTEGVVTSLDGLSWTTPTLAVAGVPAQVDRGNGRYVGVRWTDRGWSDDLAEWTYATWATEPLRALVFIPAP